MFKKIKEAIVARLGRWLDRRTSSDIKFSWRGNLLIVEIWRFGTKIHTFNFAYPCPIKGVRGEQIAADTHNVDVVL